MPDPLTLKVYLGSANGVCIDVAGNLYVSDSENHVIRVNQSGSDTFVRLAGSTSGYADGKGAAAQFNYPMGIAIDGAGRIYVCDSLNNRIRVMDTQGNVSTFAGAGTAGHIDGAALTAQFNNPNGICVDYADNVYVSDWGNHAIRRITQAGTVSTFAGTGAPGYVDGTGSVAQFACPTSVASDAAGIIYVGDSSNFVVRRIDLTGTVSTLAGLAGSPGYVEGSFSAARFGELGGLAVDPTSVYLYVSDWGNDRIRRLDLLTNQTALWAGSGIGNVDGALAAGEMGNPSALVVDPQGIVVFCDWSNDTIRSIDLVQSLLTLIGVGPAGFLDYNGIGVATMPSFQRAELLRGIQFAAPMLLRPDFMRSVLPGMASPQVSSLEGPLQAPSDKMDLSGVVKFRPRNMRMNIIPVPSKVR